MDKPNNKAKTNITLLFLFLGFILSLFILHNVQLRFGNTRKDEKVPQEQIQSAYGGTYVIDSLSDIPDTTIQEMIDNTSSDLINKLNDRINNYGIANTCYIDHEIAMNHINNQGWYPFKNGKEITNYQITDVGLQSIVLLKHRDKYPRGRIFITYPYVVQYIDPVSNNEISKNVVASYYYDISLEQTHYPAVYDSKEFKDYFYSTGDMCAGNYNDWYAKIIMANTHYWEVLDEIMVK